jgi:hypothetical protein
MEICFFYGAGMLAMCVEPNSIIKDVLKKFLVRNDYYGDPDPNKYIFKYKGKTLNSPIFINRSINNLVRPGGAIEFLKKSDITCSGGEHICPYGCGRLIPDEYKGCTELLQAKPNYFS